VLEELFGTFLRFARYPKPAGRDEDDCWENEKLLASGGAVKESGCELCSSFLPLLGGGADPTASRRSPVAIAADADADAFSSLV